MMCSKCVKGCGALFLVFGVLFLLRDLGVWDFWNIGAWTIVFVMFGLAMIGKEGCPMCKEAAKKKK